MVKFIYPDALKLLRQVVNRINVKQNNPKLLGVSVITSIKLIIPL